MVTKPPRYHEWARHTTNDQPHHTALGWLVSADAILSAVVAFLAPAVPDLLRRICLVDDCVLGVVAHALGRRWNNLPVGGESRTFPIPLSPGCGTFLSSIYNPARKSVLSQVCLRTSRYMPTDRAGVRRRTRSPFGSQCQQGDLSRGLGGLNSPAGLDYSRSGLVCTP